MKLGQIIRFLLVINIFPLLASAEEGQPIKKKDYYFATMKIGLDQPVTHGGNASIDNVDTTYIAGLELGKKFMEIYGISFEYKKVGTSDFTVNSVARDNLNSTKTSWSGKSDMFMANASIDVIKHSLITPYFKFGIGASVNNSSDYVVTVTNSRDGNTLGQEIYGGATNTRFAWQVGLGLNITSNELFDIDMEYMFLNRGQFKTKQDYSGNGSLLSTTSGARTTNLRDHSVTIGLRAKF